MLASLGDDHGVMSRGAAPGQYLLEQKGGQRIVWRISEGEPPDDAFEPAGGWLGGLACERVAAGAVRLTA
jgi:hypothetical protein